MSIAIAVVVGTIPYGCLLMLIDDFGMLPFGAVVPTSAEVETDMVDELVLVLKS